MESIVRIACHWAYRHLLRRLQSAILNALQEKLARAVFVCKVFCLEGSDILISHSVTSDPLRHLQPGTLT